MVHQRRLPGAAGDNLHHPATVAAQELRYVVFVGGFFVMDCVTNFLPGKKAHVCVVAPLCRLSRLHKRTLSALHGVLPDCGECVFMIPRHAVRITCL